MYSMCQYFKYLTKYVYHIIIYLLTLGNRANSNFMGGSSVGGSFLYQGVTINLNLKNLAAYKLVINYKLFSDISE